jgi:hypothetical protein
MLFPSLREEHRLRIYENNVLTKISGPKIRMYQKEEENCIMRDLIIPTHHKMLLEGGQMKRGFLWQNVASTGDEMNAYKILIGERTAVPTVRTYSLYGQC